MKRIRVVVVDDSALMRKFLRETLSSDPAIEVVGAAHDPFIARDMIKRLNPDVLTLDIMMPGLDGLEFLHRIMKLRPLPVIMFSALTRQGSEPALNALAMGAVDFVAKPQDEAIEAWREVGKMLIAQVKTAASAHVQPPTAPTEQSLEPHGSFSSWPRSRIVAIGSSTGGVQALRSILADLPEDIPPVLIVQHMPPAFTASFARRLDASSAPRVCEAYDGCEVSAGRVYVAPGDKHLLLDRRNNRFYCRLEGGAEVNGHMPSIDLLFQSVADVAMKSAMGILLTGMGRDGALGLKCIHDNGGITAAQDEATSLIYGMPKVAVDIGAAQHQLSLDRVSSFLLSPRSRNSSLVRAALAADAQ
jgi:two-component system chemotaxis response regulator CheB